MVLNDHTKTLRGKSYTKQSPRILWQDSKGEKQAIFKDKYVIKETGLQKEKLTKWGLKLLQLCETQQKWFC